MIGITHLYPSPFCPGKGLFNRYQLEALGQRESLRMIVPIAWRDRFLVRSKVAELTESRWPVQTTQITYPRLMYPPALFRGWHGYLYRASIRSVFLRALAESRPDVVLSAWAYPDGWAAVELAHESGLPAIIKVHGSDILKKHRSSQKRVRIVEALRRSDGIVAVSQHLAERIRQLGVAAEKISVIYDGIDSRVFHPGDRDAARRRLGIPLNRRVLLYVGRLVPVKGLDVLIAACQRLKTTTSDFSCYLIGEGPLKRSLIQQVIRCDLADQVRIVGSRTHDELPDWYRAADVFVLPSHSEGVPCALLEAIASGIRFVATRVGGIPEVAGEGHGHLVEAGRPEELCQALLHALNDVSRRSDQASFARSHQDAAADLAAFMQKVIDRTAKNSKCAR